MHGAASPHQSGPSIVQHVHNAGPAVVVHRHQYDKGQNLQRETAEVWRMHVSHSCARVYPWALSNILRKLVNLIPYIVHKRAKNNVSHYPSLNI